MSAREQEDRFLRTIEQLAKHSGIGFALQRELIGEIGQAVWDQLSPEEKTRRILDKLAEKHGLSLTAATVA